MTFKLVKKVPIVEIDGKKCFLGNAKDNPEFVPSEGVIGYDFFNNFTVFIDRLGGKMVFVYSQLDRQVREVIPKESLI